MDSATTFSNIQSLQGGSGNDTFTLAAGVGKLRVDCYAGGSGDLVRWYESCGYTRTDPFLVGDWPGQVLERRVALPV